ncbi:DUF3493 domain-containing protein [Egbenema bharatensis]|uniref:DUF3493 domain-containing protein n=1 Tax=Egbenema bharatensis TaxID=3463334 RepID=UPI003A86A8ED
MTDKSSKPKVKRTQAAQKLDPELYAQLRAELKTPYKGLRQFVYFACGASGLIGAFIFLTQLIAGKDASVILPNFALQVGVVALMIWLFRLEQRTKPKK